MGSIGSNHRSRPRTATPRPVNLHGLDLPCAMSSSGSNRGTRPVVTSNHNPGTFDMETDTRGNGNGPEIATTAATADAVAIPTRGHADVAGTGRVGASGGDDGRDEEHDGRAGI